MKVQDSALRSEVLFLLPIPLLFLLASTVCLRCHLLYFLSQRSLCFQCKIQFGVISLEESFLFLSHKGFNTWCSRELCIWLIQGFGESSVPVRISVYIIRISWMCSSISQSMWTWDLCTKSETHISHVEFLTVTECIWQWYSKDYVMKLSYIMRSLWYQVVIKFSLMLFPAILKMAWKSQPFIDVPLK